MAYTATSPHDSTKVRINYQLIRNVTSPEEKDNGVQTYIMNAPAEGIAHIGTSANLRNYIAEHSARKRNAVHKAIETTILTEPDRFINRNSGITITCSSIELDDKKKFATLTNASIINGAQTQGEILRYLTEMADDEDVLPEAGFHVRVEINIDPKPASIVETAIARNSATSVQSISQAGARGHLNELDKIMIKQTGKGIRRSETQTDVHDTFHILRCARLLMPPEVSGNDSNTETLRPYMNKAKCLDDFSEWFTRKDSDKTAAQKYQFVLDIASRAIAEYEYWERSDHWYGNRIWEDTQKGGRACKRDKDGNVVWMSPGLMYPLLNAVSALVVEESDGHWVIDKPKQFKSSEMIRRTVQAFREHDSKPMLMGRSPLAYSSLINYPQTLVELIRDFEAA
jgi:AIPR protein